MDAMRAMNSMGLITRWLPRLLAHLSLDPEGQGVEAGPEDGLHLLQSTGGIDDSSTTQLTT